MYSNNHSFKNIFVKKSSEIDFNQYAKILSFHHVIQIHLLRYYCRVLKSGVYFALIVGLSSDWQFQVLNGHMWPVATTLDSLALDIDFSHLHVG